MRPEVIVHHLAQAKAALAIAEEAGIAIQLRSAPGAAAFVGVDYLRALGDAVGHDLLIDCDDDPGLVMAALRAGCRKLVFSGAEDQRERLREMAGCLGASLNGPKAPGARCIALLPDDNEADALGAWLSSRLCP